ncbi:MAG TPA: IS1182 family transposase [Planctomycetota bacterium]|nr:IS1182 family transposase [Planctomycetota bacterium]
MAKTFRPWDVDQAQLFPPSVRDLVPPEHVAHFVRELVRQELDLSAILDTYSEERGYPPHHPAMMTALLLYGYSRGVYSSRRLEQACLERVDFMAVTAMNKPDHSRISEFRRRHLGALQGLFVQVLGLCGKAGLVKLGHVALDGTKVKANASKHAAMSWSRMKKADRDLKRVVDGWLQRAEDEDAEEDAAYGKDKRGDELPDWVKDKEKRRAKIREAMARLKEEAEGKGESEPPEGAQSNFTDPESRILRTKGTYEQGYNCQAAVDAGSQVIVAEEVVAQQNDNDRLLPLVDAVRENTGSKPREVSADTGYLSEENLEGLEKRRIRGYVAVGKQKHGEAGATSLEYRTRQPWTRAMWARLRRAGWRSRYRLRKQVVEPVFGQIKAARGYRQFLLRGLEKVRGEWSLLCTAHNVLKLAAAR